MISAKSNLITVYICVTVSFYPQFSLFHVNTSYNHRNEFIIYILNEFITD